MIKSLVDCSYFCFCLIFFRGYAFQGMSDFFLTRTFGLVCFLYLMRQFLLYYTLCIDSLRANFLSGNILHGGILRGNILHGNILCANILHSNILHSNPLPNSFLRSSFLRDNFFPTYKTCLKLVNLGFYYRSITFFFLRLRGALFTSLDLCAQFVRFGVPDLVLKGWLGARFIKPVFISPGCIKLIAGLRGVQKLKFNYSKVAVTYIHNLNFN